MEEKTFVQRSTARCAASNKEEKFSATSWPFKLKLEQKIRQLRDFSSCISSDASVKQFSQ